MCEPKKLDVGKYLNLRPFLTSLAVIETEHTQLNQFIFLVYLWGRYQKALASSTKVAHGLSC